MKFKVRTHSVIGLITNSSTEMFMDFQNSIDPLKELINEFFKLSGIEKTCDEVFKLSVVNSNWEEWFEDMKHDYPDLSEDEIKDKARTPDGESKTELLIETIDDKYEHLGELVKKLMESPDLSEYMC